MHTIELSKRKNSLRLTGYDYGSSGIYFVTLCTQQRRRILSSVKDGKVELSKLGELVSRNWLSLPEWFSHLELDHFVIMPDHFHALIQLTDNGSSLGTVIGSFKSATSRLARSSGLLYDDRLWQRGYYDRIVRSESALLDIRQYIDDNPIKWNFV